MRMIGTNVLVTEAVKETESAGGIILTGDTTKGSKPALVLDPGAEADYLKKGDRVFLDWTKVMPVDVDGKAAAIVDMEFIKAVL